ncbi:glycoside hydrolase [Kitasatospora acidiphila]|uniref:Glycoside hydrolase n=1 Tax=Kitasatospora acidiphila TaxID=2567942 RepID=A0A540VY18_9ACTN|nr:glycosyl hydrolase family 8 [Kitasatospora acidiphila]TQF01656.1 glycoside hydrolase [Kitasatospora acidiphila]
MRPHGKKIRLLASTVVSALLTLPLTALATAPAGAATVSHPFPSHTTYKTGVLPSASQASRDAAVQKQYDSWKANYLVHGCASNEYYVSTKGDGDATNNGPVSEGQGYGMNIVPLMAGYDTNAQTEFNGLWQLVKDHKDQWGLMEWQLDGKTCTYYSSGTPDAATDGDLDIGYGLVLADAQWGGYTADAKAWLAGIYAHDVAPDGHLKCEDDGPNTDTRPSDHMLDHLRAFAAYDTAHDWNKVITRTEAVINEFTAKYSAGAGLLSDFVVNADTTSPQPAPANYQESQPDNIVGYNSIRVPWHLGTDALLYGGATALATAKKEEACAKQESGGNPQKVYPHTKLDCTPYSTSDQAEEAGDAVGPAAMAAGDQAWTDTIWNYLATNPFGDGYYGETIKTLVYLVMAGDYWSPSATGSTGGGGCTAGQLLGNQGFENGANNAPWSTSSTLGFNPITSGTSAEPAHSGSWIAWFNGNSTADTDTAAQTVTIPPGCTATLSYWLHTETTENTSTAKPDTFKVQLLSTGGTVLTTLATYSNLDHNTGYTQHTVDVSGYAGQTVTVKFTGTETDTSGGTTDFVIDDTALATK